MIKRMLFGLGCLAVLLCFSGEGQAQTSLRNALEVGSWFGRAVPDDPSTSPFSEVVMMPTFLADGTVIANDSIERVNLHGTGHGNWEKTGPQTIQATFVWLSLSADKPNGFVGITKVRLFGRLDPNRPDEMTGKIYPVFFPEGTDALVADDANGIPLGVFTIEKLDRIKVEPTAPAPVGVDLRSTPAMGTWFGRALPENPATATFPEIFIEPTFMDDGNVIFNDSHEERAPHGAAHGQWAVNGSAMNATFFWLDLTAQGLSGVTRGRFTGQVSPTNANQMTGSFSLVRFAPGVNPLTASDAQGTPLGTYVIQEMGRLRVGPEGTRDLRGHLAVGTWVGRAVPDDPAQSPFPEVYMTPTFHGDGNLIANDAIATSLHHTAHGDWFSTGTHGAETTFLFVLGTPDAPNGYGGAFKIRLTGDIDPANPNVMTGKLFPLLYPPEANPLDPNAQSQPVVSLSYQLRRVPIQKQVPAFQPPASDLNRRAVAVVTVTQNNAPLAGVEVAFSRAIAGLPADYAWRGTTGANGRVNVRIEVDATRFRRAGATGYYSVQATNPTSGAVVGTWHSVPINGGKEVAVSLPVGGKAQVLHEISLANLGVFTRVANSPNPFNPSTHIAYELMDAREVRLVIYNHLGQEVRVLVDGFQASGLHRIVWDGKDASGRQVGSGLYLYRLSSGESAQTGQMLLLK